MKRTITVSGCLFLLTFAALNADALVGTYSGGAGTPGDPAQIANSADLLELAATPDDYSAHFMLTADINLAGYTFTHAVIAEDTDSDAGFFGTLFMGTFNGNGHVISNLTINASGQAVNDYLGLFGYIEGSGAKVFDLTLAAVSITGGAGSSYVGGLCGSNDGLISGCSVSGSVTVGDGSQATGGLCGHNLQVLTNCQGTCILSLGSANPNMAGGLCGHNEGVIVGCGAGGSVSGGSVSMIGGLCGLNEGGAISNSLATGAATGGASSMNVGGLCGNNALGGIVQCYATGGVTGKYHVGGLCGSNSDTLENCYATGGVTLHYDGYGAGGLCGINDGSIAESYSTGSFTLDTAAWEVGGLLGVNEGGSIVNSFWDTESSGTDTSAGGAGKTTSEMQTQATFTAAGWDFVDVWVMDGYPALRFFWTAATYALTVNSGSGDGSYTAATEVPIVADTPATGHIFDFWSVSPAGYSDNLASSNSASTTFTMPAEAVAVTANYKMTAVSVQVGGPDSVDEDTTTAYTCFAYYSDGSSNDVTTLATWSVTPPGYASINSSGHLTAFSAASNLSVTVQACYTDEGGTNNDSKAVAVLDDVVAYGGGSGTQSDPYRIASKTDLMELGATPTDYDKHFIVTSDIDLSGETFTHAVIAPDTAMVSGYDGTPFSGTFDGQGHVISNLTIDVEGLPVNDYLGLFGRIEDYGSEPEAAGVGPLSEEPIPHAMVINLGVVDYSFTCGVNSTYNGGLCGENGATISNCYATGSITGGIFSEQYGGLCGYNTGMISNCYALAAILFGGDECNRNGGFCGFNEGVIVDCYASGSVTGSAGCGSVGGFCGANYYGGQIIQCHSEGSVAGHYYTGGLCGSSNDGTSIVNCYSTCSVAGHDGTGGLCGNLDAGSVLDSYATGTVTSGDNVTGVGGLCGASASGSIMACYAAGAVSVGSNGYQVGGLCGEHQSGMISNCYATGAVAVADGSSSVGGFAGYNGGTVGAAYSVGAVTVGASTSQVGGFCGYNKSVITGSFWDTETSGMSSSSGGTGRTTAQMQTESTFTEAGWDFAEVWLMSGYPLLVSSAPPPLSFSGGSGTEGDPYQIATKGDLLALAGHPGYYDKCYIQTADIDLAGETFVRAIIAPDTVSANFEYDGTPFSGQYDGCGCVISNMTINTAGAANDYIGLFGMTAGAGCVLSGIRIQGYSVSVTGLLEYVDVVGVVCGENNALITRCFTDGVLNKDYEEGGLGAICGYNKGTISRSSSSGSVICERGGGICGRNEGVVTECFSACSITGSYVGGISKDNSGTISQCYFSGEANGSGSAGGICTWSTGSIQCCYVVGRIIGGEESSGIVPEAYVDTIENCYVYLWSAPADLNAQILTASEVVDPARFDNFDFGGSSGDGESNYWEIVSGHCPKLSWQVNSDGPLPPAFGAPSTTLAGSGLESSPFVISNLVDFIEFATNSTLDRGYYLLASDIDLSGFSFTNAVVYRQFGGYLEGAGHQINNLLIDVAGYGELGLFRLVSGSVFNLGVANYCITNATENYGIGGLCAINRGSIEACFAQGDISIGEHSSGTGGLCGNNEGRIILTYATGSLTCGSLARRVGGLVGENRRIIDSCYAVVNIETAGAGCEEIGGLCGISKGSGRGPAYIDDSYSRGRVIADGAWRVGGFLGHNEEHISRSYSSGYVQCVGGTASGGFVGSAGGSSVVEQSFWDYQTSLQIVSAGGIAKTTLEMQTQSTFTTSGANWNFNEVWFMEGYPALVGIDGTTTVDYLTWADSEGIPLLERGPEDMPAGDGIPNLLKYACGLSAMTACSFSDLMNIASDSGVSAFSIIYPKSKISEGILLQPVWTAGLSGLWIPEGITHELISSEGNMEMWKASIPLGVQGFMRLRVQQEP